MNKLLATYKLRPVVPVGQVNGMIRTNALEEFSSTDESDDDDQNVQYEKEFVAKEKERYVRCSREIQQNEMSQVDGVGNISHENNPLSVYSNYNFDRILMKKDLPIEQYKKKILSLCDTNAVLVIQGPTGCGKSTQVPQFFLDHCKKNNEYCNIAVTQPRRIATITLTKRVCQERGWNLGTVCGYQVGLEKKTNMDTVLTYMTTGVMLQKLINAKSLQQFTHIIIDEVHERDQDLDFLMLIVRRFLFTNSPKTKVILMSATIDTSEFANYFENFLVSTPIPAPILYITKQLIHTTKIFYLDDMIKSVEVNQQKPEFDIDKPEITQTTWTYFTTIVNLLDKLDQEDPKTKKLMIGCVLIFLPGILEIEEAHKNLMEVVTKKRSDNNIKWQIIPLHSSLPFDELKQAFEPAKPGHRKIILSTNIAESSITIPETNYVIDFCLTKVMAVDPSTKFRYLKLEWASHENCSQRAGRVGRTTWGRVYRLVTKTFYMNSMPERGVPEMTRAPLEQVVLRAKMLNMEETPSQILALALDPPKKKAIEGAVLALKEMGGLLQTCRGVYTNFDGDITFLGIVMSQLPIDVHLTKLIIFGYLFGCLEESIIMAAGASIQNIFSTPFQARFDAYKKMLLWSDGSFSDLIALLNLFQVWQSFKRERKFETVAKELQWCRDNYVNIKGLREWNVLVNEIKLRLQQMNIANFPGQSQLNPADRALTLKIITAGAFYPNYFIKETHDTETYEKDAVKTVGGRNPFRTVYFTGMNPAQPGPIYTTAIKDLFKNDREERRDITVGFDGSSKIYVEFASFDKREQVTVNVRGKQMITNVVPGRIPNAVYEAIRKRQLKHSFDLRVMPLKDAWSFAREKGIERITALEKIENMASTSARDINCFTKNENFSPVPSLDVEWMSMKITEYIDAGNFWVNTIDSEEYLEQIDEILKKQVLHGVLQSGEKIELGKLYAAKYSEDLLYYRCQVISFGGNMTQVLFIDYGNIQQVKPDQLCLLPDIKILQMPPLAVECTLRGIKPSKKFNPRGIWSDEVTAYWKRHTLGFLLNGHVHSVVDNVVHLELYRSPSQRQTKSINQMMVEMEHAELAIDSFQCKADHQKRLNVRKADNPGIEATRLNFDKIQNYKYFDSPTITNNYDIIKLKGPFSPLEMTLHGCIRGAKGKIIDIDGTSINTVLLDNEPQDYHAKLLVAGYVAQTAEGNRLKLRNTCLMPNIPGLPMILSLIFCPTMQAKLTKDATRVASILCGLGYVKLTGRVFYPTNDLVLTLDTELTETDIIKINKIRYYMNQGIKLINGISERMTKPEELIEIQIALKRELLDLLSGNARRTVERVYVKYHDCWGKNDFEGMVLKPTIDNNPEDIWPLLSFYKLRGNNPDIWKITKNLEDMDQAARNMVKFAEVQCILCDVSLYSLDRLRLHLISGEHKYHLDQYNKTLAEEDLSDEDSY